MKVTPKSCPFCGSISIAIVQTSSHRWVAAACNECSAQGPEVRKQAMGDGTPAQWWEDAEQEALKVWNRREPET